MDTQDFETRLKKIEQRNAKVEQDKKWETSLARKIAVACITYIVLAAYFGIFLGVNPWISALVPTIGFLLSTMSLSVVKDIWMKRHGK
jgi:hypothetical protein